MFLAVFTASEARAGACSPGQNPFTDVPDGSIFCSEALWLRNALVTLGCGTGTVSILTDAAADMYVYIQFSVNGGLFQNFTVNPPRVVVPGNQWTVVPVIAG